MENNKELQYIDLMKNDENFKLIGFEVEAIFNDYNRFQQVYLGLNLNEVNLIVENILLNKKNCDDSYFIEYTPIYEILNKNYYLFSNVSDYLSSIQNGEVNEGIVNKKIEGKVLLIMDSISISLKTPKENIPDNYKLVEKLNEEISNIIDCNGRTNYNVLDKIIELIDTFKKTK
jgi:hypothetical protein